MSKTLKTMECDRCCREVHKVSLEAVSVLCWLCSMKNTTYYEKPDGSPDSEQLPESSGDD
jgi:hypothetical protein